MTRIKAHVLILSLIIGLALNAVLSQLSVPLLSFSLFPLLCLCLACYQLYQLYSERDLSAIPSLQGLGAFVLGAMLYSAVIRALHPQLGSNFVPIMLIFFVGGWLAIKLELVKLRALK